MQHRPFSFSMNKKNWSKEDLTLLSALVKTKTFDDLAAQFGCSVDAVRWQVKRHGFKKYNPNKASRTRDHQIFAHVEKHGVKHAALHFGISIDSVKSARVRIFNIRDGVRKKIEQNPKFLSGFRGGCIKAALAKNMRWDTIDDFVSWSIVKLIEGRNTTPENLLNDYFSEILGKVNASTNETRIAEFKALPIEDAHHLTSPDPLPDALKANRMFALADGAGFSSNERIVFLMTYELELTLFTISRFLRLSESRVCQILSAAHEKLTFRKSLVDELVRD